MYRHLLTIIACLLITTTSYAQTAKAYVDAQTYLNNEFVLLEGVQVKKKKVKGAFDDYDYHLSSNDYSTHRDVATKYWAVEVDKLLYLSCRQIFQPKKGYKAKNRKKTMFQPGTYVVAQYRSNKYVHFRTGRTNVFGVPRSPLVMDAGTAAMAISYANTAKEDIFPIYNYLYDFRIGDVIYFNRVVMMNYLEEASPKEEPEFIKHVNQLIKAEDENDGFRQ